MFCSMNRVAEVGQHPMYRQGPPYKNTEIVELQVRCHIPQVVSDVRVRHVDKGIPHNSTVK